MGGGLATYAFLNAKLRGRISKLLDDEFYRALARARSFVEAIAMLSGTRYEPAAEAYNRTGDVKLAELELVNVERRAVGGLERYAPREIAPFVSAVLDELEVVSAKQALRLWFERTVRGRPIDEKVAYVIRGEGVHGLAVDHCINASSVDGLVHALEGRPYLSAIREHLSRVAEVGTLFHVETALDRWYAEHLTEAAERLSDRDAEVALRLLGIQTDIRNVNWIVRMRRSYELDESELTESILPGGWMLSVDRLRVAARSDRPVDQLTAALASRYASLVAGGPDDETRGVERLALIEEMLRSILFQEIHRTLGGYPFTIGTFLAYVLLTHNEIRLLVSVLNAKYYELAPERVEELI
ncbi:MAG: V0D/AC39 family V-type ATPase subunit [Spirochaetota bacterium]